MAVYKVPQDVEAEDKLLGPFSFRQFIYLIIAAAAGLIAYGLSRIFIGLIIVPLPVVLFFLILALPLKKDQPMETYLTAVVRFWLKPRVRLWEPEGNIVNVEITAPQTGDISLTKGFSGDEAAQQLAYLSQVVDTQGWATRGLKSALDNSRLSDTVAAEAQTTEDVLDDSGSVAQSFEAMISESDEARRQSVIDAMHQSIRSPASAPPPQQAQPAPAAPANRQPQAAAAPDFNPYPSAMRQKVIDPDSDQPAAPVPTPATNNDKQAQAPSETTVSPDIMRLATSKDLSISTIAHEAERLQKKHLEDEEVVVPLR